VPPDPATPWVRGDGISATATIDGLNAGVEAGRTVLYIGTSGGSRPAGQVSLAGPASADAPYLLAGGVYRSLLRRRLVYLPAVLR
jgi:hypothetical protein